MPRKRLGLYVLGVLTFLASNGHGQAVLDSFNPDVTGGAVRAVAVQPDGKIIIGGDFTAVGGQNCASLARLNTDGSLDTTFTNRAVTNVSALALQTDGKILVGRTDYMVRVNSDGTRDTTYFAVSATTNIATIIVRPDGKALASRLGSMVRLNSNGTVDSGFSPAGGDPVMALQADGKIVFRANSWGDGTLRRMNTHGSFDTNFSVAAWYPGNPTYTYISGLIVQPDGKILVGGSFDWLNGSKNNLGRLNPDSTLDPDFTVNPYPVFVDAIARQLNGKIVFVSSGSEIRRCNAAGFGETNFAFTVSGEGYQRVKKIVIDPDGNILLAGNFTSVNGVTRNGLARIISGEVPPSAPPQFTHISKHPNNVIRFNATNLGQTNLSAIGVIHSPDAAAPLDQWLPVAGSVSLVNGAFEFTDPGLETNPPVRFYRLSYQP